MGKHNKLGKTGYKHTKEAKHKIAKASRDRGQGRTSLKRQIINLFEYRQWRSDVFERDCWKCLFCGVGGKLEADHIKAFSAILRKYEITTLKEAKECAELWDINNGRTLCRACHTTTDNYGHKARKQRI